MPVGPVSVLCLLLISHLLPRLWQLWLLWDRGHNGQRLLHARQGGQLRLCVHGRRQHQAAWLEV